MCQRSLVSQLCFEKQERAAHSGSEVLGSLAANTSRNIKLDEEKQSNTNPAHFLQLLRPLESTSLALGESCYIRKCIYLSDTH